MTAGSKAAAGAVPPPHPTSLRSATFPKGEGKKKRPCTLWYKRRSKPRFHSRFSLKGRVVAGRRASASPSLPLAIHMRLFQGLLSAGDRPSLMAPAHATDGVHSDIQLPQYIIMPPRRCQVNRPGKSSEKFPEKGLTNRLAYANLSLLLAATNLWKKSPLFPSVSLTKTCFEPEMLPHRSPGVGVFLPVEICGVQLPNFCQLL